MSQKHLQVRLGHLSKQKVDPFGGAKSYPLRWCTKRRSGLTLSKLQYLCREAEGLILNKISIAPKLSRPKSEESHVNS